MMSTYSLYLLQVPSRSNQCLLGFDFTHAAKPAADHFQPPKDTTAPKRHSNCKKTSYHIISQRGIEPKNFSQRGIEPRA